MSPIDKGYIAEAVPEDIGVKGALWVPVECALDGMRERDI